MRAVRVDKVRVVRTVVTPTGRKRQKSEFVQCQIQRVNGVESALIDGQYWHITPHVGVTIPEDHPEYVFP